MIQISLEKKLRGSNGAMQLHVDMEIEQGQLVTLYGESGVGKTSLLRMIAGLMQPDAGLISVNGVTWFDSKENICLKPQERNTGFVFQDYALFPNMTIKENLDYALNKGMGKEVVDELIQIMQLEDLQHQKPVNLSGGQKQRVALARALVRKPCVLMLDEPLSALDLKMRNHLQDYVLKVHKDFNLSTILISHEIGEVIKMADTVYVIDAGKIVKQGNPIAVFSNRQVSGKFQFAGEIIQIDKEDVIYVVTILIGANIVRVVADESEILTMKPGDKVMVASKAFNPLLQKIT
jgi:molybdate transport system ATP-binding protein